MDPAVVSVIIKSDRLRKRFPKVGEMVRMTERKGLFLVKRVDRQKLVADLTQGIGNHVELEENVPIKLIQAVSGETSRLIEHFLHFDPGRTT